MSREPGEPIGKRNCFGWYVLGQFESNGSTLSEIQSIEVGTVSVEEDIKKHLHQDILKVKPTELCTCTENVLRQSKFVKSLAASTTLVDWKIQVKLPWKEGGPPKRRNCKSLINLEKVTIACPLMITLRKVLTSTVVFWMYWQHGNGTKWRSLVTFVKCSTKSWYVLMIGYTTETFL